MTEKLLNKTVLVTGATGLIGKALVKSLLSIDGTNVVALVRDKEKAESTFSKCDNSRINYIVGDIRLFDFSTVSFGIDYIVHAASDTSSKAFVNEPVEVTKTALQGTLNVLDFSIKCRPEKVIYLSSMEVYGTPSSDAKIYEDESNNINTMEVRSSYPEGKRMCESLCKSYASEYGVPAVVLRLTQTFGEGVDYNDGRVFAEFARCVAENKNIVLKTKGETKRSYLHVKDAVNAIIYAMCEGINGEAYNVANENTYCSIYDMASFVADKFGRGKISVVIDESNTSSSGYANTLHMNLDTSKIKSLGWMPEYDLEQMYRDMINDFER